MADENVFVGNNKFEIIHELAAPIFAVSTETDEIYMCGTATIIGPGYAITAAHVIEDFNHRFGTATVKEGVAVKYVLMIFLVVNEGERILPMLTTSLGSSRWTDIAILKFAVPKDYPIRSHKWKRPRIQLHPPSVGERIAAFGFIDPNRRLIATSEWQFDLNSRSTTGQVIEIHHPQRDAARMPFPCFRVDARFDGSMSGGPVFNSSGNLCGIVCSSLPADGDCIEHVSYATTLWPLLGMPFPCGVSFAPDGSSQLGYECFDLGLFHAVDRDQFRVGHAAGEEAISSIEYLGDLSIWRRFVLSKAKLWRTMKRRVAARFNRDPP